MPAESRSSWESNLHAHHAAADESKTAESPASVKGAGFATRGDVEKLSATLSDSGGSFEQRDHASGKENGQESQGSGADPREEVSEQLFPSVVSLSLAVSVYSHPMLHVRTSPSVS